MKFYFFYFLYLFSAIFMQITAQSLSNSILEEEIITSYKKDSLSYDFIRSLSAIDSTVTSEDVERHSAKITNFITSIPEKEEKAKKEKKRIQKIYNNTHDTFFKKYEEVAYFPQIFENGVYNCVTATALYTYIFNTIGVPYAIKDAPGHVYLIAYPKTHKIVLETTAPGVYGFRAPKDAEVREQVEQLITLKLVTAEEVKMKGESAVFIDYFYGNEELDKASLIGMQYYNMGLQLLQKENYKEALKEIKKSLIFYPYVPSEFLYKGLIQLSLEDMELNNLENITSLVDMFNSMEYGESYSKKDVLYYIYRITEHDDNDLDFIENAATKMSDSNVEDVKKISKEAFYEYLAKSNANNSETNEAIRTSDSLLSYNPKSKVAKEIITYSVGKKLSIAPVNPKHISELELLYEKYDFLTGNIKIETYRTILFGRMAAESFNKKNPIQGKLYLKKFESLLDNYASKLEINPDAYTSLYLQAGRYYYGQTKNTQALELFERGLKYTPENAELKKMRRWAKEDMN